MSSRQAVGEESSPRAKKLVAPGPGDRQSFDPHTKGQRGRSDTPEKGRVSGGGVQDGEQLEVGPLGVRELRKETEAGVPALDSAGGSDTFPSPRSELGASQPGSEDIRDPFL